MHTTHMSRSHSQIGSQVSQRQNNTKAMQLEIDNLKKKLRHAQRNQLLPVLISPLMMKRVLVIGKGQELHQASISPMMKSTITNVGKRARLVEAWEMTL